MDDTANAFTQFGFDDGGAAPAPASSQWSVGYAKTPAKASPAPTAATPPPATADHANPFAQFGYDDGSPVVQPAEPVASPHPGVLANSDQGDSWLTGAAKGATTAAIKGAGDAIGFAGNLRTGLDYGENWIESKFTGETPEQVGGRRQAAYQAAQQRARGVGGISGAVSTAAQAAKPGDVSGSTISDPILARTGEYVPTSEPGRLGMAGVETAVGAVGPGMGSVAAPGVAGAGAAAARGLVKAAPTMAAAGASAQGVTDATGSPMAGLVTGFVAPMAAHAGVEVARQAGGIVKKAVPPLTEASREAAAQHVVGSEMRARASDPAAAADALQRGNREIVPGSKGTTAEISGDTGLVGWQKGISNTPEGGAALNDRAAEQNAARQAHLAAVQPDGNALDLPSGLREQRAATDAATRANVSDVEARTAANMQLADTVTQAKVSAAARARQAAIDQMRALPPDVSPTDFTGHVRSTINAVDAENEARVAAAQHVAASDPVAVRGGQPASDVGAAARGPVADALAASKERLNGLWRAVDPTGKMVMPSGPIAEAANGIKAEVTPSATPMAGEEARIFDVASKYGPQTPFKEVTDLRSSISTAMRAARQTGDAQQVRRLTMLRGSVENAIDHAVENQAALDQVAVRRGTAVSDDAMTARVRQWVDDHYARQQEAGLASNSGNLVGASGVRSASSSRGNRTASAGDQRLRGSSGDEGIPSAPSIDPDASERLKAASAATREQKETFGAGAAGQILREGGSKGEYRTSDAQVPAAIFRKGAQGAEAVRSYMDAKGSPEALFDAAAMSARQAAIRPDGTLDPAKISQWTVAHREAISAMPESVSDRFLTSIDTHQAVEDALAARRDAVAATEKSEAGKAAKLTQPGDIVSHVGRILDGTAQPAQRMQELASAAKGNPAAEAGLKRAVLEHVLDKFVPEVGDPRADRLDAYVADKGSVLSKVLAPADLDKLKAQSADIQAKATGADQARTTREAVLRATDLEGRAAVKAAQAERAQKMSEFEKGTVGQLVGTTSRGDILNILKGVVGAKDGGARMEALAQRAAALPGGTDALKRGVLEMIQRDVNSTTAVDKGDTLQMKRAALADLMAKKRDVLQAAGLSGPQMNMLDALVKDGMQANRSISLARARGGSDTEANRQNVLEASGRTSIISRLAHEAAHLAVSGAGGVAGYSVGGPVGAMLGTSAGWLGRTAIGHLREAGLNRIRELRIEAALNPDLALQLLQKAPRGSDRNAAALLALRAKQLAVMSGTRASTNRSE